MISMNYQATGKRKTDYVKAELAVAEAMSKARHASGKGSHQSTTTRDDASFIGSFFHTTDQFGHFSYGSKTFYTTNADVDAVNQMNIRDDIDLILCDAYKHGKSIKTQFVGQTVSVKNMNRAVETGNVSFELKTYVDGNPSDYRLGWISTSKADWYALVICGKVVLVKATAMKELIDSQSWTVRDSLSRDLVEMNKEKGRYYTNASNLLIPVNEVLAIGHVLDLPEWYYTFWKKYKYTSKERVAKGKEFWAARG